MKISKKFLHSKWTSIKNIKKWNHFEVINIFKRENKVELFAICDKSTKIKINFKDITNINLWLPGWKNIIKEKNESN